MADNVSKEAQDILQNSARHINCLSDENKNVRKRALQGLQKDTLIDVSEPRVLQLVFNEISKPLLKVVSDPVEKCRELAISYLTTAIQKIQNIQDFLPYIIPVFVQRLGQQEIIEPSEELRLDLVVALSVIIECSQKEMASYLDDVIKILQRTIVDPYPDLRKESCKCACKIAKAIPEHFHQQSESLIKPLTESISHQHSRVRVEVIMAIGKRLSILCYC